MTTRFVGVVPDPVWRTVLAHYLGQADTFRVHMPDGAGPLSNGRAEIEALPGVTVGPWGGMRDAVELTGPLSAAATSTLVSTEASLADYDPDRKLWDYQLLRGDDVLLSVGDFIDLLIDEPDADVLRRLGVQDDERP